MLVLLPALFASSRTHPTVLQPKLARDGLECGVWFALGYMVQACALEQARALISTPPAQPPARPFLATPPLYPAIPLFPLQS